MPLLYMQVQEDTEHAQPHARAPSIIPRTKSRKKTSSLVDFIAAAFNRPRDGEQRIADAGGGVLGSPGQGGEREAPPVTETSGALSEGCAR